jgi:hypothetical protein
MRILAVLPLLASLCAPAVHPGAEPAGEVHPTTTRSELVHALEVLHEWDVRRARAWARDDLVALRALYVRGSGAGRADVRLLRAYRARGLVVRRLVTQVFAVRVLRSDRSALQVRVFDRVAGGEVLDRGAVAPLRSSRPVTRTITFRLESGSWRVSTISGSGRGPRAGSPRHPDR